MSSLTETAVTTKKTINYLIIGIIIYIVWRIFWMVFSNWWIANHPPLPPPPNTAFGKIEELKFPNPGKELPFAYQLETINGGFTESSSSAKVYFMPLLVSNLLSFDRAKQKAEEMGFQSTPIALSPEEYLWSDPQNPLRSLTINIVNGNISLSYDYRQDTELLAEKNLPQMDKAIEEGRTILENYELKKNDLVLENPQIFFLKIQGGQLAKVNSLSEADFIKLGYNRSKLDEMEIVNSQVGKFPISLVLSGSSDAVKRITELIYRYQIIDNDNFATYPLKTQSEAYNELIKGNSQISNPGNLEKKKIIRKIYLAYYDSLEIQTYLQPVYVFEGDHDFKAYVQAVSDQWVSKKP